MDSEGYKIVSEIVAEFGCRVTPEPAQSEDLRYFDVVSDDAEIEPAVILNAISKAVHTGSHAPSVVSFSAQKHRLTVEDLQV